MLITLNKTDYVTFCANPEYRILSVTPHGTNYEVSYAHSEASTIGPNRESHFEGRTQLGEPEDSHNQEQLRGATNPGQGRPGEVEQADAVSQQHTPETRANEPLKCPACENPLEPDGSCEICSLIERARDARNRKAYEYALTKASERRHAMWQDSL